MKTGEYWKQSERKLPTQADMSQLAKDDYEKSNTDNKLAVLKRMGKVDQDCASYEAFRDALAKGRPIIFFSIGTTGMKADDEIMQLAIGGINFKNEIETKTFLFPVSKAVLDRAEETKKDYDIFANGGFDRPVEKNGLGVSTKEYVAICKANAASLQPEYKNKRIYDVLVNEFGIKNRKDLEAALIVGLNPEFAQKYLEARQFTVFNDSIDILNVIKEYDFSQAEGGQFLNANGSRYSLAGVVGQYDGKFNNGDGILYSSANKVDAMKFIASEIAQREHLIEKPAEKSAVIPAQVADEVGSRAKELDLFLTKLVQTFVEVIENNTRAMQELKAAVSNIRAEKEEPDDPELDEFEEEFDK